MNMIFSFLLALSLSTIVLPALIRYAATWRLLDIPDDRKRHVGMIPRVGGIAIAISTLISAFIWSPADFAPAGFLVGSSVIAFFGLLDDRNDLDYRLKFGGQIIGAIATFALGVQLHHFPLLDVHSLPYLISLPCTVILLLGSTNAFNLLDGLDGLAAGCASLSLLAIAVLALTLPDDGNIVLIAVTALGGILGFLRYNTHPAVVYMGDTGSQFLGFSIGVLAIMLVERSNGTLSPAAILPLLGLPVIDTLMVMVLRLRDGRSPFSPDRNHIHHKLLSIGFKHHQAVAIIYVIQAALVFSAVILRNQADLAIISVYCIICGGCVAVFIALRSRYLARGTVALAIGGKTAFTDIGAMFSIERVRNALLWYVELSVALYLIAGAVIVDTVTAEISAIALSFAAVTLALGVWQQAALPAIRLASYLAAIYVSYLSGTSTALPWLSSVPFYVWLGSVALAVGTIMTLIPRDRFQVSTQDLLVVLVILGIVVLPVSAIDNSILSSVVIRAIIFIYACELLIVLKATKLRVMGIVAALSLLALGVLHVAPPGWDVVRSLWSVFA